MNVSAAFANRSVVGGDLDEMWSQLSRIIALDADFEWQLL